MTTRPNSPRCRAGRHECSLLAASLGVLSMTSAVFAQDGDAGEPTQAPQRASVTLGVHGGYGLYQSERGGWIDAYIGREFGLVGDWALQAEIGPVVAWNSQLETQDFHYFGVPEDNYETNVGYGLVSRALFTWQLASSVVLHGGLLLGYAIVDFDSSVCGTETMGRPTYGVSLGPALRLGHAQHIEIGAMVEMVTFPFMTCSNGGDNPNSDLQPWPLLAKPREFFDDPGFVLGGRLTYRLF